MIYLAFDNTDPFLNLAFEEYVLRNRTEGDYLLLWRSEASVIIGRHQNLHEEVHTALAEQLGVPVLRRESGGGAVFHDPGNLNFSFIADAGNPEDRTMERFTGPVAEALREWGIPAKVNGRNDIEVNGRKVSGSAQTILHGRILHHGTLLFDADLDLAQRLLRPDERKFTSKGVSSVRARIGNLLDELPHIKGVRNRHQDNEQFLAPENDISIDDLMDHLIRYFHCETEELRPEEYDAVRKLSDKYRNPERLLEESMDFDFRNSAHLPGGTVEVLLRIEEHRICRIRLRGDFLSLQPVEELEQVLAGTEYSEQAVRGCLSDVDLSLYLGSISADELIRVLF